MTRRSARVARPPRAGRGRRGSPSTRPREVDRSSSVRFGWSRPTESVGPASSGRASRTDPNTPNARTRAPARATGRTRRVTATATRSAETARRRPPRRTLPRRTPTGARSGAGTARARSGSRESRRRRPCAGARPRHPQHRKGREPRAPVPGERPRPCPRPQREGWRQDRRRQAEAHDPHDVALSAVDGDDVGDPSDREAPVREGEDDSGAEGPRPALFEDERDEPGGQRERQQDAPSRTGERPVRRGSPKRRPPRGCASGPPSPPRGQTGRAASPEPVPAARSASSAWYDERTNGPEKTWRNPRASPFSR